MSAMARTLRLQEATRRDEMRDVLMIRASGCRRFGRALSRVRDMRYRTRWLRVSQGAGVHIYINVSVCVHNRAMEFDIKTSASSSWGAVVRFFVDFAAQDGGNG